MYQSTAFYQNTAEAFQLESNRFDRHIFHSMHVHSLHYSIFFPQVERLQHLVARVNIPQHNALAYLNNETLMLQLLQNVSRTLLLYPLRNEVKNLYLQEGS